VTTDLLATRRSRTKLLEAIYEEIAEWTRDVDQVPRIMSAVNPCAEVVVIGEAVGPNTVRLSGVNYFGLNGMLSGTGKNLDEILGPAGLTLYPQFDVNLVNGRVIAAASGRGRRVVYSTDLYPQYPGFSSAKGGGETRGPVKRKRPSQGGIMEALKREFLDRELKVVRPKAIVLLGSEAYRAFYTHFLGRPEVLPLTTVIGDLEHHVSTFNKALVIPCLHPSTASSAFQMWLKKFRMEPMENPFVRCIRRALGAPV
jgi:uracil-DNA glycosylase